MSSFSKTISKTIAAKYKEGKEPSVSKALDSASTKATNEILHTYVSTVKSVVGSSIESLATNFSSGYSNLSPRLRYDKRDYPAYADKFWRYSGDTKNNFRVAKNVYLTNMNNAKSSTRTVKTVAVKGGKVVTIRLYTGIPKWSSRGMQELIMGKFYGRDTRKSRVPYGLRTLVFNEEGVQRRIGRGGVQPARPVIGQHMDRANKVLRVRLGRLMSRWEGL